MNYRQAILLSHEDISTPGTRTLDLTIKDVISRIIVQIKATNNGSAPTAHPAAIVSRIELVDGSDVLFSLSGKEALALEFYDKGVTPFCTNNYLDDVMNITTYQLNFGRWLYDEVLALDPTKFRNPQLKVTHNIANGGSSPDAATMEVMIDSFDQKVPAPVGFLMNKELVSYVLAADANEYIDLPLDYAMRKILILSLATSKQPWEQFAEVKLSEDNDKRVPFNDRTSDLIKYLLDKTPRLAEYIVGEALTTTRDFYMMSTYEVMAAANATGFGAAYITSELAYGGNIDIRGLVTTNFMANITGACPFGAICLPFGKQHIDADWYNVMDLGSLQLTIKGGSAPGANSTCEVVTQQMRMYPT